MVKTKQKIIQAAIDVWKQNLNATLEDISNHLGISLRTLHRHFEGRNDLIQSVYNILKEDYLESVNVTISDTTDNLDRLKKLFINDIECAERYIVFSHLHETYFSKSQQNNPELELLYATYRNMFNELKESNQVANNVSVIWLELFYSTTIQTVIKAIKSGLDKDQFVDMAWNSFWNGIKN